VTQQLADQFGVKVTEGVVVTEVLPDSPAAQAGLKQGDVILSFNGKPVTSPNQLQGYVEQAKIGGQQSLVIKREGQEKSLAVVTREQPAKGDLARKGSLRSGTSGSSSSVAKLGLEVETLKPEVAEQLELKAEQGVVITRVKPGSLADQAGIAQGMVITEVNRKPVKSAEEFQKILDEKALAKGAEGVLLVTDAMSGAGMPAGDYMLGGLAVMVRQGVARVADGALAGSTLTLERGLSNFMAATGWTLAQALPAATRAPARVLGLGARKGDIAPGYDADLVALDPAGQVALTVVGGAAVVRR